MMSIFLSLSQFSLAKAPLKADSQFKPPIKAFEGPLASVWDIAMDPKIKINLVLFLIIFSKIKSNTSC